MTINFTGPEGSINRHNGFKPEIFIRKSNEYFRLKADLQE
jgi:hypothetical protein